MARRSNFIEGNDNFREQNLRFVRNEFEDNINQFFGGANPGGGSSQQKPPPRDSLIVQPTPGDRNLELDIRRQFIRELGASRMTAHALAVRTFKVKDFNLRYFQRQRFRLSVELGDSRQNVVDAEVLRAIGEAVENKEPDLDSRPRTPSPPRNIDWHNANRNNSPVRNNDRSRPRNRQGPGDFRGVRDNNRGFLEQQEPEREREPFNRNAGPKNGPNHQYNRNLNSDNRNANRNNRNTNPQQEFQRNANPHMEFNQNIRHENREMIRNNHTQMHNRNPNTQENVRNNRNTSNNEFNRSANWQEIIRNNRKNQNINRNVNSQEFNRNPQEFNRNMNPQEFNRNMNPQGNRDLQLNPREIRGPLLNQREMPQNFNNQGANSQGNPNFRALQFNPREVPQKLNNPRFNNNNNYRGPHHEPVNNDFMEADIDGTPIIDDSFLESHPNLGEYGGPPQIGRNYQRIVNNNQITICRQDWIEANRIDLNNLNRPNNRNPNDNFRRQSSLQFEDQDEVYNDGPNMEDDDHFRRQHHHGEIRKPGFRGPEDQGFRIFSNDRNFEGNQGNFRDQCDIDSNYHGRGRNDRNERRQFNDDNYENDRERSNDSVRFRGSNHPDVSPKRFRRGSGSGDRYHRDHHPQPVNPHQNRSNQGRHAPNTIHTTTSQDRTMDRISNSSGRNPRTTSKIIQDRNPGRNTSTGVSRLNIDRNSRSTSLTNQSRSTSGREKPGQVRSAPRSVKPDDANLRKPTQTGQKNRAGDPQICIPQPPKNTNKIYLNPFQNFAGQKRKAESKESESNRPSKVDYKRKKQTTLQNAFIIGGFRLPYINNNEQKLPQSEDQSYAVTFFEQTPIYNTNIYAIDDGQMDDPDEQESDAESLDSNQSGSKGTKLNSKKIIRNKLTKEWMAVYRKNKYKDWYAWWKDYKWCGIEINKELAKLGDRNMCKRFTPKYPTEEMMVSEVFRCGRNGLKKNTFNYYRNMRSIFLLMNETFLKALSEEQKEQLQDLIRYIPNHLWLYKIRSMVYLWERYHRILKNLDESEIHKENELKAMARQWRDPLFHWLAKQAFDELKAISGVAWPEHRELYHGLI
ncbi:hypothetical protein KR059_012996 [Drosophila kikkawai]|nr:hypothetical protein KR059_012996 [Drosophila kikkawai]